MDKTDKFKDLIKTIRNREEFAWLSGFQLNNASFVVHDKAAPIKNIRHTYSVRGAINRDRGNPIKGFEWFLRNLETTKTEAITIHCMMDIDGYEYRIFTDPAINELIGILRLVKQSEINF